MSNTLGTNLSAKIADRVTVPIWLVKIETPSTTLHKTTWAANVPWDSETWTPEVMRVSVQPAQPNSSAAATVGLSGNTTTLNFLLLEDLSDATVTIYETQAGITYSTDDVLLRFTGEIDSVRSRNGWGEMKCVNSFENEYLPNEYFTPSLWGPHLMLPGTYTIGGRTFVLEQELY